MTSSTVTQPSSSTLDFPQRFRFLFVHLKVHKAIRHLINSHPNGGQIPLRPDRGFDDLSRYDWSRVKVRLVMSVPGNYHGVDQVDEFGLCRLGKVLSDENWLAGHGEVVKAEFQVSGKAYSNINSDARTGLIAWDILAGLVRCFLPVLHWSDSPNTHGPPKADVMARYEGPLPVPCYGRFQHLGSGREFQAAKPATRSSILMIGWRNHVLRKSHVPSHTPIVPRRKL